MCITIIVACDPNGVIGKLGKLPWRMPEDLRLFREKTLGNVIVMGRKTWQSLPKKPLDGRLNVIVSRTFWEHPAVSGCGPYFHHNLKGAIDCVRKGLWSTNHKNSEIFIIGGAELYKTALDEDVADRIIMSKIKKEYGGDVKFPLTPGYKWTVQSTDYRDGFDIVYLINKDKLIADYQ